MHPSRVARITATIGAALLLVAVALRLLSIGYTTSMLGVLAPPPQPELPQVGGYQVISGGTEIRFRQGDPESSVDPAIWYSMSAEGGAITPTGAPEEPDLAPFRVSDEVAYLQGPAANSLTRLTPPRELVTEAALAPDGQALAFITRVAMNEGLDARHRLYVMHLDGVLEWLGEEAGYFHLDWSPDSRSLAFIATREGYSQLFTTGEHGEEYRALTADPSSKSSPAWSPDGRWIAYFSVETAASTVSEAGGQVIPTPAARPAPPATPAAAPMEIMLIRPDGQEARRLAATEPYPFGLDWIVTGEQAEVVYPVPLPDDPATVYLYAAAPDGSPPRRAYPPVMIDALECPTAFTVETPASARLTLTNSGLVPVDLPLQLREQHLPFTIGDLLDFVTTRISALLERRAVEPGNTAGEGRLRVETVTLLPGETRVVDLPARAEPGARLTRITALTGPEDAFPIPALSCSAPNTNRGLPNLPFLGLTLPLAALGMLLCVPQLLRRKSGRLWAVWAAVPFLFWMMILVETRIKFGG